MTATGPELTTLCDVLHRSRSVEVRGGWRLDGENRRQADRPLPFNHHAARRHRILRAQYRGCNWPMYDSGLRRQSDLTGSRCRLAQGGRIGGIVLLTLLHEWPDGLGCQQFHVVLEADQHAGLMMRRAACLHDDRAGLLRLEERHQLAPPQLAPDLSLSELVHGMDKTDLAVSRRIIVTLIVGGSLLQIPLDPHRGILLAMGLSTSSEPARGIVAWIWQESTEIDSSA